MADQGEDPSEVLANRLLEALDLLQKRDYAHAAIAFEQVHAHPALIAAPDMVDVRIRALTLHAQALLGCDGIEAAQSSVMQAMRLARESGDTQGLSEARILQREVLAKRDERSRTAIALSQARRVAATSVEEIRTSLANHPQQLCDALIKKANAHLDLDQAETARVLADDALAMASDHGWLREEVLARLSIARAAPSDASNQLHAAWRRAERANDFTLVGAVARAAELQGVRLPVQVGPVLGSSAALTDET